IYRDGPGLIEEILINDLNIPFNRNDKGELDLTREAAHSKSRIIHVNDNTGKSIQEIFYKKLKTISNIKIFTDATCVDLITLSHHSLNPLHIYEPSTCVGAYVFFQNEDRVHPILAKETILATGGLGRIYLHTSNPITSRGEGYAMAYRAGARIMNMEYIQFHPTTLFSTNDDRFLITEAMRGEGAILRNKFGQDFMKRFHKMGSLAPRDVVSRSIIQEMNDTSAQYVYLDITHRNSDWIKKRFPTIYEKCLEVKVDITSEGIPVVPAAHFECGGVTTDDLANTTIRRLKAVGEVACTGLHGANRLASSSLLEGLVFGTIAGRNCFEIIKKNKFIMPRVAKWKPEMEPVDSDLLYQDWLTIKHTMWNYVGIVRNRKKLERAFGILWRLKQEIESFYAHSKLNDDLIGLRNAATTSLLVLHAARLNRVSRGCHYMAD
ncbi:MAG: L-aspartate oxidase, partial [Candidatus Neomarinimicrobiota bacterium]